MRDNEHGAELMRLNVGQLETALESLDRLLDATTAARDRLLPAAEAANPEIRNRVFMRDVLGLDSVPDPASGGTPDWKFVSALHDDLTEVARSVRCLANVPVYLRRFPFRHTGVARSDHLQYHLENWLHEIYILEERFRRMCSRVERARWNSVQQEVVVMATTAARDYLSAGLTEARSARGAHVHERRLVEPGIAMLRDFEALVERDESGLTLPLLEQHYRDARSRTVRYVEELNTLIDVVFENCMAALCLALLGDEDDLLLPTTAQPAHRADATDREW